MNNSILNFRIFYEIKIAAKKSLKMKWSGEEELKLLVTCHLKQLIMKSILIVQIGLVWVASSMK